MGYCMNQMELSFRIKKENIGHAMDAIRKLHGDETISDSSGRHFSWVDSDFHRKRTFVDMMSAWRWHTQVDEQTGDVRHIYFEGEKSGDDNVLFEAIAPFVEKGSFIQMQGEDGAIWRWYFDGDKCKEQEGKVTFG